MFTFWYYKRWMHWFLKLLIIFSALFTTLFFIVFVRPLIIAPLDVSNAQKYGVIWQNERWSGTIRITGDLFALPGVKIEVLQGTQIYVSSKNDKSNMDFYPNHAKTGINDSGQIKDQIRPGEPFLDEKQKISVRLSTVDIKGVMEQPVIIASDAPSKSPYDFNKISIRKGVVSYSNFSNFRRLEIGGNVTIRDSVFTDIGECSICINSGSPTILNNVFIRSLRDHIWVEKASPRIANNIFLPDAKNGIVVNPGKKGHSEIANNEFQVTKGYAVVFLTGGEKVGGVIIKNLFASGDISLPCDSKVSMVQNHIKTNLNFQKSGNCVGNFLVDLNYWEIDNPKEVVKSRITGTEPQFKINLTGVLKQSPKDTGRI